MRLNSSIAISTNHILLIPYESHHVPTYHKWMSSPSLQTATASEPLSLDEEYAMQRSWREDGDKLTFIICLPLSQDLQSPSSSETSRTTVQAGSDDTETQMLGDVNLFITPSEDDPQVLVGECELMIADSAQQGKGYGRFALLAFLKYVTLYEEQILREYRGWVAGNAGDGAAAASVAEEAVIGGKGERIVGNTRFGYLRVRIGKDNARSMALFDHVGFSLMSSEPNYFGELEMRMYGHFLGEDDKQFTREWWGGSWRVAGWNILDYKALDGNT